MDSRRTSFGDLAGDYDAVRPEWPVTTLDWLLGSPAAGATLDVLDLGCGTGKGTRTLAGMGHRVAALDPSQGMVNTLSESLRRLPDHVAARVEVRVGAAEDLPLDDASVDAVTVLQAWHWFDERSAARECARVLRPGGTLAMGWHHRDEAPTWAKELSAAVGREDNQLDDDEQPDVGPEFSSGETRWLRWTMRQSVDDLVRHASTWSYVAISPRREAILAEVARIATSASEDDGTVAIPMTTRCFRFSSGSRQRSRPERAARSGEGGAGGRRPVRSAGNVGEVERDVEDR